MAHTLQQLRYKLIIGRSGERNNPPSTTRSDGDNN